MAKAELVLRVDADDFLLPDYLETLVPQMLSTNADFSYSDYIVVDGKSQKLYEEKLPAFDAAEVRSRGDFLATGTLYRKSALEKLNYYDTTVKNCGLENYVLILKLLESGKDGLHIPKVKFAYRRHGRNISVRKKQSILTYGAQLFAKLNLGSYTTNSFHPYKLSLDG